MEIKCVNVYSSARISSNLSVRFCCANTHDLEIDSTTATLYDYPLDEILNCSDAKRIRQALQQGIQDESCSECWKNEAAGLMSKRIADNNTLRIKEKDAGLKYVELNMGSTCNLKCRTCNPFSSVQWEKEYYEFMNWGDTRENYLNYIKSHRSNNEQRNQVISNLKGQLTTVDQIDIFGGEPFMIQDQWDILSDLVEQGSSKNQIVKLNSNGTIYDAEKISILEQFKEAHISLSIDATGKHFEYIRSMANWDSTLDNIRKFKQHVVPGKFILNICITVSVFNVYYLPEILLFFNQLGVNSYFNIVYTPKFFAITTLPDLVTAQLKQKFLASSGLTEYQTQQLANLISLIENEPSDKAQLELMFSKINWLDNSRGESFSDTFPEFYKVITNV